MTRIHRIRPQFRDPENWSLLHDNAPSHTSLIVSQFFAQNQVCVLYHLPYSPDLASCNFSVFPKLNLKLKGCFCSDIPTIKTAARRALEAIPRNELKHAFESLLNRNIFRYLVSIMFATASLETYLSHYILYWTSKDLSCTSLNTQSLFHKYIRTLLSSSNTQSLLNKLLNFRLLLNRCKIFSISSDHLLIN